MHPIRRTIAGLFAVLLVCSSCASSSRPKLQAQPALEPAELGAMLNVSVSDGLWLGGHPSEEDLDLARRRGVERVIDVVGAEPWDPLPATCMELGMEYYDLGLVEGEPISSEAVTRAMHLLSEEARPVTLMFCADGSKSTMLFAIYRILHQDMRVEDAVREARGCGMRSVELEDYVRKFTQQR